MSAAETRDFMSERMSDDEVITTSQFKDLLAHLAGTVVIITTRDTAGRIWGFTATSFCSLSLDPPLVLFCLARSADCHAAFLDADRFAVSILAADQAELSQRFAQKGSAKYEGLGFELGELGMPRVPGALAWLECRLHATHPGGDHTIAIGMVEHGDLGLVSAFNGENSSRASAGVSMGPLLYYERGYGTFRQEVRKVEGMP